MQRKKKVNMPRKRFETEGRRFTVTITGPMIDAMDRHRRHESIESSTAKLIQLAVIEVYGG